MIKIYVDDILIWETGTNEKQYAVIAPELVMENGKVSVLTFTVHPDNAGYSDIRLITSRVKVVENGKIIFYGRPVAAERMFSKMKRIICEDSMGFLRDIVGVAERTYSGASGLQDAFSTILDGLAAGKPIPGYNDLCDSGNEIHSGIITGVNSLPGFELGNQNPFKPKSNGLGALGLIQNIVELRPGQLMHRWEESGGVVSTFLDYTKLDNIPTSNQEIHFAKNLLDLDEQIDGTGIFTALQFYDVDNSVTYTYQDANHVAAYGTIQKRIEVSGINDRWSTASDGRQTEAYQYYQENAYGITSVDVSALDLTYVGVNVDAIEAGGKYRVISAPHNYDAVMQCRKIIRKLDQPGHNVYEFGQIKRTLTESLVN